MKIGCYCESPADQAALMVFIEGILGQSPEPIDMDLQARSVPAFFTALDGVFRGVHYNSDADGLVIVVDSDDTELHSPDHTAATHADRCRYCRVLQIITRARNQLKPRPAGTELKVAVGLAVPAIEAWYLTGREHRVGEPAWRMGIADGRRPFTRSRLKELVYGTDRPSLDLETQCAIAEARRIICTLHAIESAFPVGFGLMAQTVRSWEVQPEA